MKKIILAVLVLVTTLINAQTFNPAFNWVKKTSPSGTVQSNFKVREELIKTVTETNGYVYSLIKSIPAADPTKEDIKIVKYSPSGTVLFEKKLRSFNSGKTFDVIDMVIRPYALYIIGSCDGGFNPSFSSSTSNNLTQAQGTIYYVAKYYSGDMSIQWAKKLDFTVPGGVRSAQNTSFILNRSAIDNSGDIIITAMGTNPTIMLDGSWRNAYVFKYDGDDGSVLWKKVVNSPHIAIEDVALDASKNIYIVGNYMEEAKFGSATNLTLFTNSSNGNQKITTFLVKFASSGSPVFAKKLHDFDYDPTTYSFKRRILVSADRVHVFGEYQDAIKISTNNLTGPGIYWARYTTAGVFKSVLNVPGGAVPNAAEGNSLEDVKLSSDVYIVIRTKAKSIAVAKYRANTSDSYTLLGTKKITLGQNSTGSIPSLDRDTYSKVCINITQENMDANGAYSVYLSGEFESTTDFDWGTAATNLNVTGGAFFTNSFLAKYTSSSRNSRLAQEGEENDEDSQVEQDAISNGFASKSLSFDVYPNPAQDKVTINLTAVSENETYTLKIYDIKGSVVVNQQLTPASFSEIIATDYLENGIYLIELSSATQRTTKKLIKN